MEKDIVYKTMTLDMFLVIILQSSRTQTGSGRVAMDLRFSLYDISENITKYRITVDVNTIGIKMYTI